MNDNIRIIIYDAGPNIIDKLFYYNIYYENLIKCDNNYLLTININDYKILKRHYKCRIIRYYGKRFIINFIKENKYMIISLFIGLFMLYLLSNTIFNIKINTNDKNIYNIVKESLDKYNLKKYKKKKSFDEIKSIKENILKENENVLEWLEIREKGCDYYVDITPRVKKEIIINDNTPSDIVASKDGKILYITSSSGTVLKEKNDYVKKGEVLISGNIIKGEKIAYQVKSEGRVYAEVWYTVKVTVPFKYVEYISTGEIINHYYLDIFGKKFTLIGKYESNNTLNNTKLILDKPYLPFRLYKEEKKKYKYKEFNVSESDAYKEALKRSDIKIKNMLKDDEYIISKNILKKEIFSSKIILEVFYKAYENIASYAKIEKKEEEVWKVK